MATRYWKGKAPKGVAHIDSDSDDEDVPPQEEAADIQIGGKAMNISLKNVSISQDGKVNVPGRQESGQTAGEDESEEDESDDDQKSHLQSHSQQKIDAAEFNEYESDFDEEEEIPTLQFRPVFVPKRARVTILEKEAITQLSEEVAKKELEAEQRRKQSHDLVAESIKRELAEKKEEAIPDVDDTDGLDPTGEFEAWRLRELSRIKRDKEEEIRRDEEREEIERRRALPEEQRLKEDLERAQKLREEKPKGQQKFLQKYWHKGAFHQDEEILKKHDFTEATESTVDVSLLPKVMQVRNFGKRSRTKYTHLLDQDTTVNASGVGSAAGAKAGEVSCFLCGGPHLKKDCPQNTGALTDRRPAASGANATPSGGTRRGTGSWRDEEEGKVGGVRSKHEERRRGGRDTHWHEDEDRGSRSPRRSSRQDNRRHSRDRSAKRRRCA